MSTPGTCTGPVALPSAPGEPLLHPTAMVAAIVLGVNDHLLKVAWPGWVTGKLSDFAFCYLLPLVLMATAEWAGWAAATCLGRPWRPPTAGMARCACLFAVAQFVGLKLSTDVAAWHVTMLQALLPGWRFQVVTDPTDLLALPMVLIAWHLLRRQHARRPRPTTSASGQ